MTKENPKPIGTQARAIATRKRLLDATVKSLVDNGYSNTTTQAVCKSINISRGTLLHHFSTHDELIISSVEHVLEMNMRSFQEVLCNVSNKSMSLEELARLLWDVWCEDGFYAWLELVVASRTKPALNIKVVEMNNRWKENFANAFRIIFERDPDGLFWIFFLVLNALGLEKIRSSPSEVTETIEDVLAVVSLVDRFFVKFENRKLNVVKL